MGIVLKMQENAGKFGPSFGTHSYTNYHESMSDSRGNIEYPPSRAHPRYVRARVSGIERGEDPKENWINYCKPHCEHSEKQLKRCEAGLRIVSSKDPEKTCIYRYRQWIECVENCV